VVIEGKAILVVTRVASVKVERDSKGVKRCGEEKDFPKGA